MVITTWRAVKTNHAETPSRIRTTPKKRPANHLKRVNGFTLRDGRLDRKEIGSIFTGFNSIFVFTLKTCFFAPGQSSPALPEESLQEFEVN